MSLLEGMRITLGQFFKPTVTVQYPRQTLKLPARFRGPIRLVLDPATGQSRCTVCNLCVRACPSNSIFVDGAKKDGEKKKSVTEYRLNFTTCSLCGECIEVCSSDAIEFSKDYNVVATSRDAFDKIDLVARLAEDRKVWERTHPAPAAVEPVRVPSAPAAAPAGPANPAGGASAPAAPATAGPARSEEPGAAS
ncbi:MAG: hypothetical protein A3G75_14725 [Verrucomicrobia bacterium RIFCSPLOWO2_12_FULL_64_8]|nr:MAG: hypothetical protein A3G75_14725 [Verrucomicrobia bacterium RIFCSPLOWO2_12_FULL_64_8]